MKVCRFTKLGACGTKAISKNIFRQKHAAPTEVAERTSAQKGHGSMDFKEKHGLSVVRICFGMFWLWVVLGLPRTCIILCVRLSWGRLGMVFGFLELVLGLSWVLLDLSRAFSALPWAV